ncbi:T9SS type A sorting domain-containing protein [Aureispira anguillae]|uniref:T9SS type A sorting domain-containing protein n=1 Tax=Aureispira anguillae TaxID=2864201 RepID=A0A915YE80_9BACT|nr:T9SS type A sorting domain-containing protein [Aureispira anguillae]BDS11386.1 T9SS type A sorting domain-containing protein [Aureispira anguillae]
MKTLLLLGIAFCLINGHVLGQPIFTNINTDTAHNIGGNLIFKCHDGNYLTVGDRRIYSPYLIFFHGTATHLYVNKTTPAGQLLWSQQHYINDGGHHMNVYEDTLTGEYTIVGRGFNGSLQTPSSDPMLLRIDSLGNMVSNPADAAILQQDHLHNTVNAIKSGPNRYTYLTRDRVSNGGWIWPPNYTPYTGLITLDSNKNIVQQNQFDFGIYPNCTQGGLIQTADNGFLFGEIRSLGQKGDIFITKSNSALVEEWEVKLIDSATSTPREIYQTSDSNYILLCKYNPYTQPLSLSTQLHKFTPAGTLLWSQEYPTIDAHQLLERADGSFYLASNFHDTLTDNVDIGVCILDATGNIINQTIYNYPNRDRVGGILQNDCEGFVMNGEIDYMDLDTLIGPGKCIIISDTISMLSNPCASVNVSNIETLSAQISPNPFFDYITVDFEELNHVEYIFSLFNVNGQLIQRQKIYNISNQIRLQKTLPNGIYFYKVESLDGLESTGKLIKQEF